MRQKRLFFFAICKKKIGRQGGGRGYWNCWRPKTAKKNKYLLSMTPYQYGKDSDLETVTQSGDIIRLGYKLLSPDQVSYLPNSIYMSFSKLKVQAGNAKCTPIFLFSKYIAGCVE